MLEFRVYGLGLVFQCFGLMRLDAVAWGLYGFGVVFDVSLLTPNDPK